MGKMIEKSALARNHSIAAKFSSQNLISINTVKESDVCIDFSHPDAILNNIHTLAKAGKNIVVGTTGWYDKLDEVKQIVKKNRIGLLYSPNFSIGVNLFLEIVSAAAKLLDLFPDYDVGMIEAHHNQKVDSPSGTALAISQELLKQIKRKKRIVEELQGKPIPSDAIHLSTLRCGAIPGTHSVIFDSPADTITLTHQARSREGFALGAVVAAEWLVGKQGLFTLNDLLKEKNHGKI